MGKTIVYVSSNYDFSLVNHLFGEGDFDALKPMVSTKLLESFQ